MDLICEGACNPGIADIDQAVAAYRRQERRGGPSGPVMPVPDHLADALRTLRHTPHHRINGAYSACSVCGYSRRFGY